MRIRTRPYRERSHHTSRNSGAPVVSATRGSVTTMSSERRLEETAATLDDVKNTLDEVIDNAPHHARPLEKAKESLVTPHRSKGRP